MWNVKYLPEHTLLEHATIENHASLAVYINLAPIYEWRNGYLHHDHVNWKLSQLLTKNNSYFDQYKKLRCDKLMTQLTLAEAMNLNEWVWRVDQPVKSIFDFVFLYSHIYYVDLIKHTWWAFRVRQAANALSRVSGAFITSRPHPPNHY